MGLPNWYLTNEVTVVTICHLGGGEVRAVRHELHLELVPGDGRGAGLMQHRHHLSAHHQLVPYTLGSEQ